MDSPLIEKLKQEIEKAGSLSKLGRQISVSATQIHGCLHGKRPIAGRLLAFLRGEKIEDKPKGSKSFFLGDKESARHGAAKGNAAQSARRAFKRLFSEEPVLESPERLKHAHSQCMCRPDGQFLRCQPDCPDHGLKPAAW